MKYCTKCGEEIEEGEEYCSLCGQPVMRRQTVTKGEQSQATAARIEISEIGVITGVVIIIITLLFGIPILGIVLGIVVTAMGIIGYESKEKNARACIGAGIIALILAVLIMALNAWIILRRFGYY